MLVERLSTGVEGLDKLLEGGITRGFLVAVTGEPGCDKTILSIHIIAKGVETEDKCAYVTTEESIVRQAFMIGIDLKKAINSCRPIIVGGC